MSKIKVKLVGNERCDVVGVGVVKPGQYVELESMKEVQALPRWKEWWKIVLPKDGAAEPKKEVSKDG